MSPATAESGSFRDRRGSIFYVDDRVLRTVMPMALDDFDFVRSTGLIDDLIHAGELVGETRIEPAVLGDAGRDAALVLEHPRLPFISYPYEWCYSALKDAALLHLDIQLKALAKDVTMTDASAYNVQFLGSRPVFIDSLSFRRYRDAEYWAGHRQFCEQFVNPLLLGAIAGIGHHTWYRGSLDGITAGELARVLPWYSRLSWQVLTNVFLQARFQRSAGSADAVAKAAGKKLPRIGFEQILRSLRRWIGGLEFRHGGRTVWQDYATDNSYAAAEQGDKAAFVREFVAAVKPKMLLDIGCNTGDYSLLALENGATRAIGLDFDHGALEKAYAHAKTAGANFLPLLLDAMNPSPALGWQQQERAGFSERARGDAVFALALVHHLAIAKNVPLDQVIDWLLAIAPRGVIEFVPKQDPMVQRLLQLREDLFDNYGAAVFERLLANRARIVKKSDATSTGRTLYWFERNS